MTTKNGYNLYVTAENIKKKWPFSTYSMHGKNNGLIHYSTGNRTKAIFDEVGGDYKTELIEDDAYGHQDALSGERAHQDVFKKMIEFLDEPVEYKSQSKAGSFIEEYDFPNPEELKLVPPHAGPILIPHDDLAPMINVSHANVASYLSKPKVRLLLGADEMLGVAYKPLVIPVSKIDGRFMPYVESGQPDALTTIEAAVDRLISEKDGLSVVDMEKMWVTYDVDASLLNASQPYDGVLVLLAYGQLLSIGHVQVLGPRDIHGHTGPPAVRFMTAPDLNESQVNYLKGGVELLASDSYSEISGDKTAEQDRNHVSFRQKMVKKLKDIFDTNEISYSQYQAAFVSLPKSEDDGSTSFVFGSCQYSAGLVDRHLAYRSYRRLAERIEDKEVNPQFAILTGDQVYVDPTAGIVDPRIAYDKYDLPYRRLFENRYVRKVFRSLPAYMMLDDHEIGDNWQPLPGGVSAEQRDDFRKGLRSFFKYQRGINISGDFGVNDLHRRWYRFVHSTSNGNKAPFFISDTRTERKSRDLESIFCDASTIMSDTQFSELTDWLDENKGGLQFVVSPSILLPRKKPKYGKPGGKLAIQSDSWDGYPVSLDRVLGHLAEKKINDVVFLSGDEHLSCDAKITISDKPGNVLVQSRSIHCSGLYAPFPFANSKHNDLITPIDEFDFEYNCNHYRCRVETKVSTGSIGFASLNINSDGELVKVDFLANE